MTVTAVDLQVRVTGSGCEWHAIPQTCGESYALEMSTERATLLGSERAV